jgi:dipeptidyl aminopeptidase/acylaminoacyl peptidase
MTRWLPILLMLLCAAATAHAQKRAFGIEDFYHVQTVGDLQVSADGTRAAYTVTTTDLPRGKRLIQIWLMDLGSGQADI